MRALAYYNYGRWVTDCPGETCTNAMAVEPGEKQFTCQPPAGCGVTAPIDWPAAPAAIEADLAGKPESAQHWMPAR